MREILQIARSYSDNQAKEILEKTPNRFIKYLLEVSVGYELDIENIINDALFDASDFHDIIIVRDISFSSTCEHHLLPFFGDVL